MHSDLLSLQNRAYAIPQVPCYFIFGDSLSDTGNNNKLATSGKVNYPPYGIDFPRGPTGRFTDGRTMHDFIVKRLGFEDYMPSFAEFEGKNILNSVNYASGAAGILDTTGNHQEFANILIKQLSVQLKTLHDTGARKFAVYGLGLIGCTPDALSVYRDNGMPCIRKLNDGVTPFNEKLKPLIDELSRNLTDAKFTYLNPSGNLAGLGKHHYLCLYEKHFMLPNRGGGDRELCRPNSKPCRNPRQYLFWDGVHPSDVWNEMLAKSAYDSEKPEEAHPFNIRKLAMHPC
ncbi:putative GDSL-like Lipase/Acylhydrolase superfamily protein [Hibiscus syriacus]|uniref:GDSL-like Lipase/Acylhydrolase superfamily protein n=1 Tax=Hibiscus syriacus TaxID=106335 RepID=A0A6A2X9E0_HIBSY|nr:putative GDSL-like Lipase/Acylhydrolase superfamily protein [Hibiscus syriacus]